MLASMSPLPSKGTKECGHVPGARDMGTLAQKVTGRLVAYKR
jgi:hypothetical protein